MVSDTSVKHFATSTQQGCKKRMKRKMQINCVFENNETLCFSGVVVWAGIVKYFFSWTFLVQKGTPTAQTHPCLKTSESQEWLIIRPLQR